MLVDLDSLVVDDVEIGVEALGESLCQLFFHRHWLIWISVDRAFELLQTVAKISPLSCAFESLQDLRELVSETLGVCSNKRLEMSYRQEKEIWTYLEGST